MRVLESIAKHFGQFKKEYEQRRPHAKRKPPVRTPSQAGVASRAQRNRGTQAVRNASIAENLIMGSI